MDKKAKEVTENIDNEVIEGLLTIQQGFPSIIEGVGSDESLPSLLLNNGVLIYVVGGLTTLFGGKFHHYITVDIPKFNASNPVDAMQHMAKMQHEIILVLSLINGLPIVKKLKDIYDEDQGKDKSIDRAIKEFGNNG